MKIDIVSYLRRPFPGFNGLEWNAYYEYAYLDQSEVMAQLEMAQKVADIKDIGIGDAITVLLNLRDPDNKELLAEHFDLLPIVAELTARQKVQAGRKRNDMAKIVMRSRLKPIFWEENKDVLAELEIEISDEKLDILRSIKPSERIDNKTQCELVEELIKVLPSSLVDPIGEFALIDFEGKDESAIEKETSEADKETDPLDDALNASQKLRGGKKKAGNISTATTKKSNPVE